MWRIYFMREAAHAISRKKYKKNDNEDGI